MPACALCSQAFDVTAEDLALLQNISPVIGGKRQDLPPPTQCPDCRERRRLIQANQLNLYKRTCDLTGEPMITQYAPDSPHKVYLQKHWFSDAWDPLEYGRPFDFGRPFFEQYVELLRAVPRPALLTGYEYDENSEYTNHAGKNKNCYLIFDSDENRDCSHSYSINRCVNCSGGFRARSCELCLECIDVVQCYDCRYLQDCSNCNSSLFLKNCSGCKNCIMCSNLVNKEYHIENKMVSREEFEKAWKTLHSRSAIQAVRRRFAEFCLGFPQKSLHGVQNENVLGDYLNGCKDSWNCFDSSTLWDCRHVFQGFMPLKNCMDIQECGEGERMYECAFSGYGTTGLYFCQGCLSSNSELFYSMYCYHCTDLFGCSGLRRKKHCVLNVQYSPEDYVELTRKIIAHMRMTGEWGEFFPMTTTAHAYDTTIAQEYYPRTKEQVEAEGLRWAGKDKKEYRPATAQLPDLITDVADAVTGETLACGQCARNYRLTKQELALHLQMGAPLEDECFFCAHQRRQAMRNKRVLYARACMKCAKTIHTTYDPGRPEVVYCEECYLKEVY